MSPLTVRIVDSTCVELGDDETVLVRGPVRDWLSARRRLIDIGDELTVGTSAHPDVVDGVMPGCYVDAMEPSPIGVETETGLSVSIGIHCVHYSGDAYRALHFENARLVGGHRESTIGKGAWLQLPLARAHRFLLGVDSLAGAGGHAIDWAHTGSVLLVVAGYLPDPVFDARARVAAGLLDRFYQFDEWLRSQEGWRWRTELA